MDAPSRFLTVALSVVVLTIGVALPASSQTAEEERSLCFGWTASELGSVDYAKASGLQARADSIGVLDETGVLPTWHSIFSNLPGDFSSFARITFSEENLTTVVGLSALTAAFLASDHSTYRESDKWYNNSSFAREGSDVFVSLGDGRGQFILAGGFAAYGLVASDRRALRTASQTVEAFLATGVTVQLLKHITGRESPLAASSPRGRWAPFPNLKEYHKNQPKYFAYPSGHIATAMATVTVVAENYPEVGWIRPVGYTVVGLIGASLVNSGFHWYSDLPLGVAIGHTFGLIASRSSEEVVQTTQYRPIKLSVVPSVGPDGSKIVLSVLF